MLNELANVACRTMRLTWAETRAFLSAVTALVTVLPLTEQTHRTGLALAERYSLSVYSALIAACALNAGCDTLQSEDMQHGILIEGRLPVVNPFRAAL